MRGAAAILAAFALLPSQALAASDLQIQFPEPAPRLPGPLQGPAQVPGEVASGSIFFLQVDPNGYQDSPNLYAGFANDPVNHRDPTGRQCSDCRNFDDPAVQALGSKDRETLDWATSDEGRGYGTALCLKAWKDSSEAMIRTGVETFSEGVGQFIPTDPNHMKYRPQPPDGIRGLGGGAQMLVGSGEVAVGLMDHPYTVAIGLGLDASLSIGEEMCLTASAIRARRAGLAKRAARMGLTPLEYDVQVLFSAKAKAGMRIVNVGHPTALAEAASKLGVRLDDIAVADGVARVSINFTHTVPQSAISQLSDHLAARGARTVLLDTGSVTNPLIRSRLLHSAQTGKSFLGATVRAVDKQQSIFELVFELAK